ncbi:hypothetical protein L7F22_047110 [Adiantum nelumboides]|nr:hypothetical protein [Adiantum nelumboides]
MRQLKQEYPDRILIASIMEEYNKDSWEEIIERVEETGILIDQYIIVQVLIFDWLPDALEINFSCPHGMPERMMGAAVGGLSASSEVCGWINAKATVPVWAKMTPNITDNTQV